MEIEGWHFRWLEDGGLLVTRAPGRERVRLSVKEVDALFDAEPVR